MMIKPKYHVFICDGTKCNGKKEGICANIGSKNIFDKLEQLIISNNLSEYVLISSCGCFRNHISERGPNMVIYPEGTWYGGVTLLALEEIVKSHFMYGKVVDKYLLID